MYKCTIIGISDRREQWFTPEVLQVISKGKVFSGGRRHHEIMASYLPEDARWIDITVPLSDVFEKYSTCDDVVIFASGDPLFFGFAATVQREVPGVQMMVYPSFNSLQMLAHRLNLPYQDMHVVSLTGRPWDKFDEALISGESFIGVLTDRHNTPQVIWNRMLEFGYDNYRMTVGENLGNEEKECVSPFRPDKEYAQPNCLILQKLSARTRPFGIPESEFHLLNGRAKMITKMPIRLLSLSMLDLHQKRSMWDVGFCTGSVSIEAKLQFPHLQVTAFEVREEGKALMEQNSRKFGTPGITAVIGDFLETDTSVYPAPDSIFIGGHGGRLKEMILKIKEVMKPGACIVFNSVSEESKQMFEEGVREAGMQITRCSRMALDDFNPIYILKAE